MGQNDHREDAAHFRIVFRLVRDPKRDEGGFLYKMSIETLENSWTAILAAKKGDAVGLNVLLCSFLLGFGLNAYVAVGIKQAKPWAWVVTIDDEIVFWDAASGERFKHVQVDPELPISKQSGAKPKHTFKTIDCLFNHSEFYGNIQDSLKIITYR